MNAGRETDRLRWLNGTTAGIGFTSLFSDWSHEIATTILPAFLASLGAGPGWLGIIEGTADGLSSVAKILAGHWTDRARRRKPLVLGGYVLTTAATAALAAAAWLGRGGRVPGRKALLAAAAPPETYGRAFGFERMMDTVGAIVAPLTALWLLAAPAHNYRAVFASTLIPGALAIACFALLVRERLPERQEQKSFRAGLTSLPYRFRWFLLAVGVFGLGDFSHTLLILYAMRQLGAAQGMARAASLAVALYLVHNVFYAGAAYFGGWLGDRASQRKTVLAAGYALGIVMAVLLALGPHSLSLLGSIFAVAGIYVGIEEALEDSMAAELVPAHQHGMAFGALAAVNSIGDFVSSLVVGLLWSAFSPAVAFGVVAALFLSGAALVLRLR